MKGGFQMSYEATEYNEAISDLFIAIFLLSLLVLALAGYIFNALIYYKASEKNGFSDLAYIAWIPIVNIYSLFLLTASGDDDKAIRAAALKPTLIFTGLILFLFLIPLIGLITLPIMFCLWIYYSYRLMYRWSGDTGKAVLYTVLSVITGGLFHAIYGLMHMNQPFKA
ncbi:hypothetical protein [Lysinibacillus xylanilyticus]|uniref:Yip1 domain-containing protein n=1 Tax=Lysinibacillus xylanilyticus TaxID=582475 RepID=A0ABV3W0V6_9BACI